jgi:ATP-dependent helicase/nuclease subunit B
MREEHDRAGFEDHAMAREAPLARNCARLAGRVGGERRARGATLLIEQSGRVSFPRPAATFT